RWTIRFLGDEHRMSPDLRAKLASLAASEPDSMVRSQLASSCQRWEAGQALAILGALARRDEDQHDPHIPSAIWWAVERQLRQDRDSVVSVFSDAGLQRAAIVRDFLHERIARALASGASDDDFAACARLLAAAPGDVQAGRIIAGLEQGLEGRRLECVPAPLAAPLARIWKLAQPAPGPALTRLPARLGSQGAAAAPESVRIAMLELLGQIARPKDMDFLCGTLGNAKAQAIELAAISALGHFDQPAIAEVLLARCGSGSPAVRDRSLALLCSRRAWAAALLDAVARGRIKPTELAPAHVQRIAQLADPALLDRLESLWGKVPRTGSPQKKQRIAEIRGLLPEGDKGSALRGKPLFKEHCAVCHKLFGDGESIGPDLTGADRGDLD